MRFHHVLDEVLGQRSKVALLRFLIRARGEHSGRDLARHLGLDHKTCHAALRSLAEQGIVDFRRLGTALVYALRDAHPIVRVILAPAFARESEILDRFVREAHTISRAPAVSVVLFGSAARREEAARSDVDILFVTNDADSSARARKALDAAGPKLAARYGSVPQFIVEDRATFRRKVARGDPLYSEILKNGRVVLGKPFAELLKHGGKADRHQKCRPQ
jgi:predicted nucleotidyltransferase